jgi:hypothetical protein
MSGYQPLHHYKHFNFTGSCTILYDISCYTPASHLPQPLVNTTLLQTPTIPPEQAC